jgi:hypothetical protein
MAAIKEFVADVLTDKLDEYEGTSSYGADLAYHLLERYNVDGSYTYSTYEAKQWVASCFDELGEIVEEMTEEGLAPCNVFDNPEGFQVCIMLYVAGELLGQCDTVNEFWNEEQELTKEIIAKIKKELNEIK